MADQYTTNAIEIKQGDYVFYVFKMPSNMLKKIAYVSRRTLNNREGIQRQLSSVRLRKIGKYIQSDTSVFPNSIIVSFHKLNFDKNKITIPLKNNAAFIIDGQHRLFGFGFSDGKELDLIIAGFNKLGNDKIASIFRTINYTQKKIDPSLVYDLIPEIRDLEPVKFEDERAHYLIEFLNVDESSPWQNSINMTGADQGIITQASMATALKKLLKKNGLFRDDDLFEDNIQEQILVEYFKAIKKVFKIAWLNDGYILCKTSGVNASIKVFEQIIEDLRSKGKPISDNKGLVVSRSDFVKYFEKLSKAEFTFESKKVGSKYLGAGGANSLAEDMISIILEG